MVLRNAQTVQKMSLSNWRVVVVLKAR